MRTLNSPIGIHDVQNYATYFASVVNYYKVGLGRDADALYCACDQLMSRSHIRCASLRGADGINAFLCFTSDAQQRATYVWTATNVLVWCDWVWLTDWLNVIWQIADEITMHVKINDIVCTIKNYSLKFTYMLLSQYEFLYSDLVIKLQSLRCVWCSCSCLSWVRRLRL